MTNPGPPTGTIRGKAPTAPEAMLRNSLTLPQTVASTPMREAASTLRRALSRSNLGHEFHVPCAQFPEVKPVLERLAWYLADMPVPVNHDRLLLDVCLEHSHRQLKRAQALSLNPVSNEVRNAWIAGLFWHTAQMNETRVTRQDEHGVVTAEWDPEDLHLEIVSVSDVQ